MSEKQVNYNKTTWRPKQQSKKAQFQLRRLRPRQSDSMFSGSNGLTNTFSSSGARLKAVVALAAVTSHRVDTAPVLTDSRLGTTLVEVCQYTKEQRRGGWRKWRTRDNPVTTQQLVCEDSCERHRLETRLPTHTSLSIWSPLHARRADTHEGTNQVFTGHALGVTVIQTLRTLILVWWGTTRDELSVKLQLASENEN